MKLLKNLHKRSSFLIPSIVFGIVITSLLIIPIFIGDSLEPESSQETLDEGHKSRIFYRLQVEKGKKYWVSLFFDGNMSDDLEILLYDDHFKFKGFRSDNIDFNYDSFIFEARFRGRYHIVISKADDVSILIRFREVDSSLYVTGLEQFFNYPKILGFTIVTVFYLISIGVIYIWEKNQSIKMTRKRIGKI